ncbi:hypothetical protein LPJ61_002005 [Coemansia biformis]|uniref:ADF-H domain-containing protein n=1 Tax=Coemansia biformis TaxID=1286918 RepID=A0A9W7YD96_9FUNG|nr:hypothetical protein LPJ61_002005 [Coemansia biformis]
MTCDLSDPRIAEAYGRILSNDDIDWMVIGYGSTRDCLSLYAAGDGGVAEMALQVPDEIVYCFVSFEGSRVLVTHVSEKISATTRGMAHQKEIAEFFSQHDVTVNTSKPSELTPTMLRDKTRHLARFRDLFSKVAGSLGRSDSVPQTKLRTSVWRQRANDSSLPSSPLATSFESEPVARNPVAEASGSAEEVAASATPAEGVDTAVPSVHADEGSASHDEDLAVPDEGSASPDEDPASPEEGPASPEEGLASPEEGSASPNEDPARPDSVAQAAAADGNNAARPKSPQAPLVSPPTPKSFSDVAHDASGSDAVPNAALSPVADEFQQTDSPIISSFAHGTQRGELSPTITENHMPPEPPVIRAGSSSSRGNSRPTSAASNPTADRLATAGKGTAAVARFGSLRIRTEKSTVPKQSVSTVASPTPSSSLSPTPSQTDITTMVDQVRVRRESVVELAENIGILGDKYYECLRGYTSIQEPNKAFWKRRYFAIADKTLFMYTNECSRSPSDYLPMDRIVSPPRDAEDEVLMPHSIAVNFGNGECYLYFDSAPMRQAFESEVHKATTAA